MKKELLIEKIKDFEPQYFSDEQKDIAIKIIEQSSEHEAQSFADFIFMKRKVGFGFDYAPNIAKGRIIKLEENKDMRINVNDSVEDDENKLIIGDNYNSLMVLQLTHKKRIDLIYIDPPYGTENAAKDGNQSAKTGSKKKLAYKDKFGRTGWLTLMKERLTLAKKLLTNDGMIAISIDDKQNAYLKVLMDEIFGEANFLGNIPRKTRGGGGYSGKNIGTNHDYLLIYKMNLSPSDRKEKHLMERKKDEPNKEKYRKLQQFGAEQKAEDRPKMHFEIKFNGKKYIPLLDNGEKGRWGFGKDNVEWMLGNDRIIEKNGTLQYKESVSEWQVAETFNKSFNNKFSNGKGTTVYKELGLDLSISADEMRPKPVELILWIIQMINNKEAIILDFFAGSGTTGHAVLEANKVDGGNRKFILATNNENDIATSVTFERIHRIINGKTFNGKKDLVWTEKNELFSGKKLRSFFIDDSMSISVDEDISDELIEEIGAGIKLIDPNYKATGLELFYDLAALNPLEDEGSK